MTEGLPPGVIGKIAVAVSPADSNRLWAVIEADEGGLYRSDDAGRSWKLVNSSRKLRARAWYYKPLQLNLPATPVTDLAVHEKDLVASTQGRGFWILDDLTPLHQLNDEVAAAPAHLFEPRPTYRAQGEQAGPDERVVRDRLNGAWVPRHMAGDNPPAGAVFLYYFADKPDGEVTLEILDSNDEVIRTFSSRSEKEGDDDKKDLLPADSGMNRFAWDLKYPGVETTEDTFVWGYTGGPTAVPGTYKVRLSTGDWSEVHGFEVKKDPRLKITVADYRAQFDLMMKIRAELVNMQDAIRRIRTLREENPDDRHRRELATIESELMQLQNEYRMDPLNFPPKLMGQMAYLYREVLSADGKPTAGAVERFEDLKKEVAKPLSRLQDLIGSTSSF